jgi:L-seryl-tRNA(Ser) seleniumtransferase
MAGFASQPDLSELAGLSRERDVPLYEDLGSGCLVDLKEYGVDEPLVADSIRAGVDLVSFSGDKLLGGPQAGIITGRTDLIGRIRRNPMYRAFRVDKLITAALEATLRHILFGRWHELPSLQMIATPADRIRERAEALRAKLAGIDANVQAGESVIGGGSTPDQSLPTYLLSVRSPDVTRIERRLREADPPVIARVEDGALLLDLRTVFEPEEEELLAALTSALAR